MWYSSFCSGLLDHKYISLAVQYYLLARVGSHYVFNPVSGSLYHLAFELFLKSYLLKYLPASELRRKKFGHNLYTLWLEFKNKINKKYLDEYDLIIKNLDYWEKVRYIDNGIKLSSLTIELLKGYAPQDYLEKIKDTNYQSQNKFVLYVDDMDKLFQAFVLALEIPASEFLKNPDFCNGKVIYEYKNKHNILIHEV